MQRVWYVVEVAFWQWMGVLNIHALCSVTCQYTAYKDTSNKQKCKTPYIARKFNANEYNYELCEKCLRPLVGEVIAQVFSVVWDHRLGS